MPALDRDIPFDNAASRTTSRTTDDAIGRRIGRAIGRAAVVLAGMFAFCLLVPASATAQPDGGPGIDPDTMPAADPRPEAVLLDSGAASDVPAGPAVSLLAFNTPSSRDKLLSRQGFDPLYMGIKEHDAHQVEIEALRILLGDARVGIACNRLRAAMGDAGSIDPHRRSIETAKLRDWIEAEARRPDFSDRYLSYLGEGGRVDPDFLIYTTPHASIARFYGEIVFEIHEATPRGVDLNGLNREVYHFYDNLRLIDRLNPRQMVIRGLFDRDEYVIPSHVPSEEIRAVEVRAKLPVVDPHRAVRLTGHMLRRYQKGGQGQAHWVDLVDFMGGFMARFTTDPAAKVPPPSAVGHRSPEPLPPEVVTAASALSIGGQPVRVLR